MRATRACLALAATLALCLRTRANDADTAHASFSTGSLLNVAEPKYVVALDLSATRGAEASAVERSAGMRSVVIADHAGARFSCELPEVQPASDGRHELGSDASGTSRQRTVAELMDDISSACFYRVEGWWTFELCVRKHVRQFHQEKDLVVSEYVLGRFDEPATARLHADAGQSFSEEASPTGAATRFHAHLFANGTACDLTGEPRSTEVRFVCAPDAGAAPAAGAMATHFIESVKEPVTCHYVLTLATPLLCTHAAFKVEEAPVAHIRCRAVAPADGVRAGGVHGAGANAAAALQGTGNEAPAEERDEL